MDATTSVGLIIPMGGRDAIADTAWTIGNPGTYMGTAAVRAISPASRPEPAGGAGDADIAIPRDCWCRLRRPRCRRSRVRSHTLRRPTTRREVGGGEPTQKTGGESAGLQISKPKTQNL